MISQLNQNNKSIGIQTIISIVNIIAKCWFNTRILVATKDLREPRLYACQLYTYGCLHHILSNLQPIKKRLMFLPGYGPIVIADWSIIVHCHLLVKHGF
jgi:hypothetical protein